MKRCKAPVKWRAHLYPVYSNPVEKMADNNFTNASDASALAALIGRAGADRNNPSADPAPVEKWNPPFCGDIDMEIRQDGSWYYMGTPIGRKPLVRLFSTILRRDEDGKTYLVTPAEKVGIRVVDAPFIAVEMTPSQSDNAPVLIFRTNVGDVVEAGPNHPLRFVIEGESQQLKPYILVRGRLEALLSRAVTHELVALGEVVQVDDVPWFAVRSRGATFAIMRIDELETRSQ